MERRKNMASEQLIIKEDWLYEIIHILQIGLDQAVIPINKNLKDYLTKWMKDKNEYLKWKHGSKEEENKNGSLLAQVPVPDLDPIITLTEGCVSPQCKLTVGESGSTVDLLSSLQVRVASLEKYKADTENLYTQIEDKLRTQMNEQYSRVFDEIRALQRRLDSIEPKVSALEIKQPHKQILCLERRSDGFLEAIQQIREQIANIEDAMNREAVMQAGKEMIKKMAVDFDKKHVPEPAVAEFTPQILSLLEKMQLEFVKQFMSESEDVRKARYG
jgi:protein-tyrosine-phosphatase